MPLDMEWPTRCLLLDHIRSKWVSRKWLNLNTHTLLLSHSRPLRSVYLCITIMNMACVRMHKQCVFCQCTAHNAYNIYPIFIFSCDRTYLHFQLLLYVILVFLRRASEKLTNYVIIFWCSSLIPILWILWLAERPKTGVECLFCILLMLSFGRPCLSSFRPFHFTWAGQRNEHRNGHNGTRFYRCKPSFRCCAHVCSYVRV